MAPAEPDTEPIKAWRSKRDEEIRRRDERSAKKHQDTVERAEKAIDDFYQDYNAKKERQIAKNKCAGLCVSVTSRRAAEARHREEEAAFVSKRTDELAQGTTWERISDLVDLQDSRSKTSTRSTRDLSRFKEALLSLKVRRRGGHSSRNVPLRSCSARATPRRAQLASDDPSYDLALPAWLDACALVQSRAFLSRDGIVYSAGSRGYLTIFMCTDLARVNASKPNLLSETPRPESLTAVHASAGSR
jgi:hypothetical protein